LDARQHETPPYAVPFPPAPDTDTIDSGTYMFAPAAADASADDDIIVHDDDIIVRDADITVHDKDSIVHLQLSPPPPPQSPYSGLQQEQPHLVATLQSRLPSMDALPEHQPSDRPVHQSSPQAETASDVDLYTICVPIPVAGGQQFGIAVESKLVTFTAPHGKQLGALHTFEYSQDDIDAAPLAVDDPHLARAARPGDVDVGRTSDSARSVYLHGTFKLFDASAIRELLSAVANAAQSDDGGKPRGSTEGSAAAHPSMDRPIGASVQELSESLREFTERNWSQLAEASTGAVSELGSVIPAQWDALSRRGQELAAAVPEHWDAFAKGVGEHVAEPMHELSRELSQSLAQSTAGIAAGVPEHWDAFAKGVGEHVAEPMHELSRELSHAAGAVPGHWSRLREHVAKGMSDHVTQPWQKLVKQVLDSPQHRSRQEFPATLSL